MTYIFHDGLEAFDTLQTFPAAASQHLPPTGGGTSQPPKIDRQCKAPVPGPGLIERPRLTEALARAHDAFAATLITGRAGTGKTCLAAHYASEAGKTAWMTLDTPDVDWNNFAAYLMAAVGGTKQLPAELAETLPRPEAVDRALALAFGRTKSRLVVFDELHKIFDAPWFGDLLAKIPAAVPVGTHVILISRTRPPGPFWRMRSKQVVNVIDENLLAFTREEASRLFKAFGRSQRRAAQAHRESFGRAETIARMVYKT